MPAGELAILSSTNATSTSSNASRSSCPQKRDHGGEQLGVAIAGAHARPPAPRPPAARRRRSGRQHRVDRRPQRRVPLEGGQAQLVGEPRVARHLLAAGRHVAELEEVRHPPVARL